MNIFPDRIVDDSGQIKLHGGLSLRDYLAAEAMKAILGSRTKVQNELLIAERAYFMADAMLGEREK
jgi:hypothetical protein